jgi:hypothetical protein
MKRHLLSSLLTALLCLSLLPINLNAQSQPASLQLGVNYWAGFWRADETKVLSELPLSLVRWGGNASDVVEQNAIITAVFISSMRNQHIEPIFQISLLRSTPEKAAAFVKEVNIDKKLGLKYWSIGNEPELFISTHQDPMTLAEYLKKWRDIATAMLKVDPSIQFVGPDVSLHLSTLDQSERDWQWFDAFLKTNGDLLNVVAFHFYPFGGEPVSTEDILSNPDVVAKNLAKLQDSIRTTLKREVPVMITEINLNWNPGVSGIKGSDSLFAGLWMAEIIGISAQQKLSAVIPWTAVRNAYLSLIDSENRPRPAFYAMKAYSDFGIAIEHPSVSVEGVKIYAGTSDKGIQLILVNRNPNAMSLNLASDVYLGDEYTIEDKSLKLAGYSFTRLIFNTKGAFVEGTTYGQHEFDLQVPPLPMP